MFKFILFYALTANSFWTQNDVTVIMPLPRSDLQAELMLQPSTQTAEGPLLSKDVYDVLPWIAIGVDREIIYQKLLKVVAMRIDPCFVEGAGPQRCQRQIRFVWQPVVRAHHESTMTTLDAAVHTFHVLHESEWREFLKSYSDLIRTFPRSSPFAALNIHPQLQTYGYQSTYWKTFSKIFLTYAHTKNLSRATAMVVNPVGNVWVFTGFNFQNGARPQQINIPRIQRPAQAVFTNLDVTENFQIRFNPRPQGSDELLKFLENSVVASQNLSIQEVVSDVYEIENPRRNNPGTIDCATCHATRAVIPWAQKNFSQWNWSQLFNEVRFRSVYNLQNKTPRPLRTQNIRALGYFEQDVVISQRVLNESAEVLRQLNFR